MSTSFSSGKEAPGKDELISINGKRAAEAMQSRRHEIAVTCSENHKGTRVLILTREYHKQILGCGAGFSGDGFSTITITNPVVCSRLDFAARLKIKLGISIDDFRKKKDDEFNRQIRELCDVFQPHIVYVVQGIQLYGDTVEYLKKTSFLVADLCDRLSLFPQLYDYLPHYDMVYTYSKDDSDELNKGGTPCIYIPTGTDTALFCPKDLPRDIDLSFVGIMYDDRREYLTKLVRELPEVKIRIWGVYAPPRLPLQYIKWLTDKRLKECFMNKEVTREEVSQIYSRSKICLNMNRDNIGNGWSDRFANIAATKSFQLITYNEMVAELFAGCVGTFDSYEDLKQKVRYFVQQDTLRESMAEACYNRFLAECQNTGFNINQDIMEKAEKNGNR